MRQILVRDNQRVHAGKLLIRLDGRDYQAALDHARRVAAERQAALAGLNSGGLRRIRASSLDMSAHTLT
jgi:membrane fusion protein, multidrug efflux system